MFCSKCGNRLEDGASFCSVCGTKANSGESGGSGGKIVIDPEDLKKLINDTNKSTNNSEMNFYRRESSRARLFAVISHLVYSAGILFIVWSICFSQLTILEPFIWYTGGASSQVGSIWNEFAGSVSSYAVEYWCRSCWEDNGWVPFVAYAVAIAATIFTIVKSCQKYYIAFSHDISFNYDESFSISRGVIAMIIYFGTAIVISCFIGSKGAGQDFTTFGLFIVAAVMSALAFIRNHLYQNAIQAESTLLDYESKGKSSNSQSNLYTRLRSANGNLTGDEWICPKCGSINAKMSDQCKDCGYYK